MQISCLQFVSPTMKLVRRSELIWRNVRLMRSFKHSSRPKEPGRRFQVIPPLSNPYCSNLSPFCAFCLCFADTYVLDAPRYQNFYRKEETDDDTGYKVAQFSRDSNPQFRSSTPQFAPSDDESTGMRPMTGMSIRHEEQQRPMTGMSIRHEEQQRPMTGM